MIQHEVNGQRRRSDARWKLYRLFYAPKNHIGKFHQLLAMHVENNVCACGLDKRLANPMKF